jgi:hypothetical protein
MILVNCSGSAVTAKRKIWHPEAIAGLAATRNNFDFTPSRFGRVFFITSPHIFL